ncbi:MAG: STAS domain-containing protein [Pseudomonadota bacterium]
MPFQPAPSLTVDNARSMLAEGHKAINDGQHAFDFSGLLTVDSVAVAVLLAWQRNARAQSVALSFINVPEMLQHLTELYGVAELLPNQLDLSSFLAGPTSAVSVADNMTPLPADSHRR